MKKIFSILLCCICIFALVGCGENKEKKIDTTNIEKSLKHNLTTVDLNYVEAIEYTEDDKLYLKIDIAYKNEVLYEGTITAIIKLTQKEFTSKYKNIKLKIIQEEPFDFIKYNYSNGKWNKEN
ncbi:hypothetical protein FDF74_12280 [Clostridium niameyense]|uniref:Lipoprotein n=1 Tax=Clostridium niameyense TaxID=1622073 RepID=A0A6M0RE73_9CLOT|nr:hypothetical protein [Clostridium niameyense]NEZ47959.1 hypothetical protein [Clostridium niameyense]